MEWCKFLPLRGQDASRLYIREAYTPTEGEGAILVRHWYPTRSTAQSTTWAAMQLARSCVYRLLSFLPFLPYGFLSHDLGIEIS